MVHETEDIREVARLGGLSPTELVKRVAQGGYEDNAIEVAPQMSPSEPTSNGSRP
jgi:hypothetical protein